MEVKEVITTPQKLQVTAKLTTTELPSGTVGDNEESPVINLTEPDATSPAKKKVKHIDLERVIMGEEITDVEINFAQQLLKAQFAKINGLLCTLYQEKKVELTDSSVQNKLQIIYCKSRHHWIVATTIKCSFAEVRVYDSIFQYCNEETKYIISNLFPNKLSIKVAHCQKQRGSSDCGLFAIAFATAVAFGINPSQLKLKQEALRAHLVNCFNKKHLSPFPTY